MTFADELYSLDVPKDERPFDDIAIEVLAGTIARIRGWRYTRRQVVILIVVSFGALITVGALVLATVAVVELVRFVANALGGLL